MAGRSMLQYYATKQMTLLNEALDDSETAIDFDANHNLQVGQHITIDSEIIKITSFASTNTANVSRGQAGTTAAAHSDNTEVYSDVWQDVTIANYPTVSALSHLEISDTAGVPRIANITIDNTPADPFNATMSTANTPYTGVFTDFIDIRVLDSDTKQILFAGKVFSVEEKFEMNKGHSLKLKCQDDLGVLNLVEADLASGFEIDISKDVYNQVYKTDTLDPILHRFTGDAVSSKGALIASILNVYAPYITFSPGASGFMANGANIETLQGNASATYDTNTKSIIQKFPNNGFYTFENGPKTFSGHIALLTEGDPTDTDSKTFGSDFYVDSDAIDVTNTYTRWNSRLRVITRGTELVYGASVDIKNNPAKGLSIEYPSNTTTYSGKKQIMFDYAAEDDKDTNFNEIFVMYKEFPVGAGDDTMALGQAELIESHVTMELISIKDWQYPTLFTASPNETSSGLASQINITNGLGSTNTNELTANEQTKGHADYQGHSAYVANWLQVYDSSDTTWKTVARIQWLDRTSGTISDSVPAYALISEIQDGISDDPNTGFFKAGTKWRQTPLAKATLAYKDYIDGGAYVTIQADMNTTQTSVTISRNTDDVFELNTRLRLGSEIMYVSALTSNTTLNVARAQEGTSAASHTSGARIQVSIPMAETTSFDVDDASEISVNDYISIYNDNAETTETMQVTGISSNTLTVTRGLQDTIYKDNDPSAIGLSHWNRLNEALDNSETAVDVDDGSIFEANDYITIDEEDMLITGISTNTLTVTRARNGTTAASHDDDTLIYKKAMWVWKGNETIVGRYPTFTIKERPKQAMNNVKKTANVSISTLITPRAIREEAVAALHRGNNTASRVVRFKTYSRPQWENDNSPSAISTDYGGVTGLTRITAASSTLLYGLDRGMTWAKLDSSSNPTSTYGYVASLAATSGTTVIETVLSTGSVSTSDTLRYYIPVRCGDSVYIKNHTANISANAIVLGTVFTEANGVQSTNWTVATSGSSFKNYRKKLSTLVTRKDLTRLKREMSRHTHVKPLTSVTMASNGDSQVDWTDGQLQFGNQTIRINAGTTASTMISSANGNTSQSGTTLASGYEYLVYWPGTGNVLKTVRRGNYINVQGSRDVVIARCAYRSSVGAKYIMRVDIDISTDANAAITNT